MDNGSELSHHGEAADGGVLDDSGGASEAAAAALACNCCRRRKLRCSREVPTCQHCRKTGSECVYQKQKSKPGMKAGAIENLHRRLDALERAVHQQGRTNNTTRERSGHPEAEHSPGQEDSPDTNGGLEKNAYNIMAFFAKELQKFNSSNNTLADDERRQQREAPEQQPTRAKRRRINDGEPSVVAGSIPALPDAETIQVVLRAYFSHVHQWIPMIHEARFRRRLEHSSEADALDVVLHAMILSASRYIDDEDVASSLFGSVQQRDAVRDWVVSNAMRNLSVESHQALIIVAFNDIGSGEAAKAWSLAGSLTRTVEYLQLTVELDDAERPSLSQPFVSLAPPGSWTEAEERRRVFWNVFKLDRFISVTMGWNTSLTSDDVRRRLPCDGILWRKEDKVATPYFGIWDKAAGRIGNPIAFIPSHYAPPVSSQTVATTAAAASLTAAAAEEENRTPSEAATSPGAASASVDMSTVGAFAYSLEATESLSRVTSYFLQQKINMRDQRDISSWLTRFKELDLRLVHWKMLLPLKWQANTARQSTRMDPNLTLAHLTHNASMILLHQLIAFPPAEWPFRARLPSVLSADTCQAAAVEIAIITENYLKHAPRAAPVSSQFAFCVYVAARVLLLRWRHEHEHEHGPGGGPAPEFWSLVRILDQMASQWAGPHSLEPSRNNLAGKYSIKLAEMHARCWEDPSFTINVLGYTTEIDHTATFRSSQVYPPAREKCIQHQANAPRSNTGLGRNGQPVTGFGHVSAPREDARPTHMDTIVVGQQITANAPVMNPNPNPNPSSSSVLVPSGMEMNGVETMHQPGMYHRGSVGSGELSNISQILLDQQFMDMDRIISFDDGIFGTEYEGGGW
ncbi:C6 transcription factor [Colletotrichum higginsianum IMI 349063]|uniref:C6 transcription factor n=1 Tax=Colletotrichum higginsianum (strain IMI 349063) TaxID=759273 RepID=A0A1B7Y556_COLHI|nr:C6 transcription factor [Colletotrichum higginsianum IMI 349063]OBR07128.1 C6 transcription factor [Colletotrichum higginsianum IMI 349063]